MRTRGCVAICRGRGLGLGRAALVGFFLSRGSRVASAPGTSAARRPLVVCGAYAGQTPAAAGLFPVSCMAYVRACVWECAANPAIAVRQARLMS